MDSGGAIAAIRNASPRATRPLVNFDFRGVDLSQLNLAGANLEGANMMNANLRGTNFTGANMDHVNLNGADLRRVNFTNAKMRHVSMKHANAMSANFTDARMNAVDAYKTNFKHAQLVNANLTGANLRDCDLTEANMIHTIMERADLINSRLTGAKLEECNLKGAMLHGANIDRSQWKGVDLTGADISALEGDATSWDVIRPVLPAPPASARVAQITPVEVIDAANASGTIIDLHGRDLTGFIMAGLNFDRANLRGCIMRNVNAINSSFIGADLSETDLTGANFIDSRLNRASLYNANLAGARMDRSTLVSADLRNANLIGATLQDANLTGANFEDPSITFVSSSHTIFNETLFYRPPGTARSVRPTAASTAAYAPMTAASAASAASASSAASAAYASSSAASAASASSTVSAPAIEEIIETAQQYEMRRVAAVQQTSELIDQCTFSDWEHLPDVPGLRNLINKVEQLCRHQMMKSKDGLMIDWFRAKYRNMIEGTHVVRLKANQSNEYYFNELSRQELTDQPFRVILQDDQSPVVSIDYGGITRDIFTRAGQHIRDSMRRLDTSGLPESRLYFNYTHSVDFGRKVAHIVRLAFLQGVMIGTPFSYGILYLMQTGSRNIDQIELTTLMYLYNMDNHDDFVTVLKYIATEALPELQNMPVYGFVDTKTGGVTADDRYYWLKRYLYVKLFGRYGDVARKGVHHALDGFLEPSSVRPVHAMQIYVKAAGLSELSEALGLPLTKDDLIRVIENAECSNKTNRDYLRRYIKESNIEMGYKLLVFITGSSDPNVKIHVNEKAQPRSRVPTVYYPGAHTCSNTLDMYYYKSYDDFKTVMDRALEGYNTFGEA